MIFVSVACNFFSLHWRKNLKKPERADFRLMMMMKKLINNSFIIYISFLKLIIILKDENMNFCWFV